MEMSPTQIEFIRKQGATLVVVAVCTRRRPKMLWRCLSSLSEQEVSAGIIPHFLVIDNDEGGSARKVYDAWAVGQSRLSTYLAEPTPGIAMARNKALDFALEAGAEYLCFIDDDEIAKPDWLAQLMAPEYRHVPVLMGANVYHYPTPAPFWSRGKGLAPIDDSDEGLYCRTASSGNVRFSMALAKAGLRFDEKLALTGGEDNDFFSRAYKMGFQITKTYRAVTHETMHPERLTYRYQVYRAYWCAASDMRRFATHYGWPKAILGKLASLPANFITGLVLLLASLIAGALLKERAFKRLALKGGKKIAKSMGRTIAIFGIMPQPYKTIHGE